MIKKAVIHFRDNGLKDTYKRSLKRFSNLLGLSSSESYFLRFIFEKSLKSSQQLPNYKVELLDKSRLTNFNQVKYYDFLNAEELLDDQNSFIYIALDGEEIVGYVCCRKNKFHEIHDLGFWDLKDNEAWIGPTFVSKPYRNKSVHKLLLNNSIESLNNRGVQNFYTAINVNNEASLKSFANMGFYVVGKLRLKRRLNNLISLTTVDFNQEKLFSKKYKAVNHKEA